MKGAPQTHHSPAPHQARSAVAASPPTSRASAQGCLPSHPAFGDQRYWMHTTEPFAAHCSTGGGRGTRLHGGAQLLLIPALAGRASRSVSSGGNSTRGCAAEQRDARRGGQRRRKLQRELCRQHLRRVLPDDHAQSDAHRRITAHAMVDASRSRRTARRRSPARWRGRRRRSRSSSKIRLAADARRRPLLCGRHRAGQVGLPDARQQGRHLTVTYTARTAGNYRAGERPGWDTRGPPMPR